MGKGFWKRAKDLVMPAIFLRHGRKFDTTHVGGRSSGEQAASPTEENPLRTYFEAHKTGPGIWKWDHYFDIYHRHLHKFRGRKVNVLEIGIFSGGSLGMWQNYFGEESTIYGIDIEPACKAYEADRVKVFIGNQGDREFWRKFKLEQPVMDVIIDDGSHMHVDQIVSIEEMLPSLSRGGVYLCEDVHDESNRFASFAYGLADQLNGAADGATNPAQASVETVCFYPFMTVIEKRGEGLGELKLEKRGTEWQPKGYGANSTRLKANKT